MKPCSINQSTTGVLYEFGHLAFGCRAPDYFAKACIVCVLVCLSVRLHISKSKFHKISDAFNRGRGSVLLWRQCSTLRTSRYVDAHNWWGRGNAMRACAQSDSPGQDRGTKSDAHGCLVVPCVVVVVRRRRHDWQLYIQMLVHGHSVCLFVCLCSFSQLSLIRFRSN